MPCWLISQPWSRVVASYVHIIVSHIYSKECSGRTLEWMSYELRTAVYCVRSAISLQKWLALVAQVRLTPL